MRNVCSLIITLVLLLTMPVVASAMDHGKTDMDHGKMEMDHGKMDMDHGKMDMDHGKMDMDHGKMDMDHGKMDHAGMMMIGEASEDGVRAMGHVKVYDSKAMESMAKMGMNATHHFMVYFKDQQTGKAVTEGTVAVKVESDDHEGSPVKLMQMGEGFGGDITVPRGHEAKLKIGTRLADGKKRQFEFELK